MKSSIVYKRKICLLGPIAVGKTSLINRYVYNRFDEKYLTTLGVSISTKILPPIIDPQKGERRQYTFLIWDIAGMDKFSAMVMNYFRGAAAALAVADLSRPDTFADLASIIERFKSVNPEASVLVIGNKADIFTADDAVIRLLEETTEHYGLGYILTSAKTGEKVETAFLTLAKALES